MTRIWLIFLLFIIEFNVVLSQTQDTVIVDKINLNTNLSEISSDVAHGYLYFYRTKRFYQRLSKYYDFHRIKIEKVNKKRSFNKSESISKIIKGVSHYHEGPAFMDTKNDKIFLTINAFTKEGYKDQAENNHIDENRLRIVEGTYDGKGKIKNIKEFPFNDPSYSFGHASYSHVTKRLYFASTRRGGKGGSDLYYSQKLKDGSWLEPVNLGRRVNTDGEELFPYAKDTILFFSTTKRRGKKGNDLDVYYISEYEILLTDPKPMPIGINSKADDFGFCFEDSAGKYVGYVTSNRNNLFPENDDIYQFKMDEIKIEKKYALSAEFMNQFDQMIDSAYIQLYDNKGNLISEDFTNLNGKVNFYGLSKGQDYKLIFSKGDSTKEFLLEKNITQDLVEESFKVDMPNADISLPQNDIGVFSFERKKDVDNSEMTIVRNEKDRTVNVRLKNIHFALNSAEIYPYSARKLDFIVEYFNAIDGKMVYLEAHTDSRGSDTYNLKLSERRAKSCMEYLVSKGIPREKIKPEGKGEKELLNKCSNGVDCPDEMHLENRRIEFKLGY